MSVVSSVVAGKVYITVQASIAVEVHPVPVMCSYELAILVTRLDWGDWRWRV